MAKQLTSYGVLLILMLVSWAIVQLNKPEQLIKIKKPAHNADFFSTGYSKVELDEKGERKSELIADKLTHYHDDDTVELVNPIMRTFNSGKLSWEIISDHGWLSADNKDWVLKGNVNIRRAKLSGRRQVNIITSNLRVKPNLNYAETDEYVEILMARDRTVGVGMQIYFTKPMHIKLLTKVKGIYDLQ